MTNHRDTTFIDTGGAITGNVLHIANTVTHGVIISRAALDIPRARMTFGAGVTP